jgi:hypothetical protein
MLLSTVTIHAVLATLCSEYTDVNTSSHITSLKLGSEWMFLRYDNCVPSTLSAWSEGAWKVSTANVNDTHIISKFGFHEYGRIFDNSIEWQNGAVWVSRHIESMYEKLTFPYEGPFSLAYTRPISAGTWRITDSGSVSTFRLKCDVISDGNRSGIVRRDQSIEWKENPPEYWIPIRSKNMMEEIGQYVTGEEEEGGNEEENTNTKYDESIEVVS